MWRPYLSRRSCHSIPFRLLECHQTKVSRLRGALSRSPANTNVGQTDMIEHAMDYFSQHQTKSGCTSICSQGFLHKGSFVPAFYRAFNRWTH